MRVEEEGREVITSRTLVGLEPGAAAAAWYCLVCAAPARVDTIGAALSFA